MSNNLSKSGNRIKPLLKARLYPILIIIYFSSLCPLFPCSGTKAQTVYNSDSGFLRPDVAIKQATYDFPNYDEAGHDIGEITLHVGNMGFWGTSFYPRGSDLKYMSMAELWIGGIIGNDTLVSTSSGLGNTPLEFHPDFGETGAIIRRSILRSSQDYCLDAISEQDFSCRFMDTITNVDIVGNNPWENRPHKPLYIQVRQESYAWSAGYAEDFILFDIRIKNIGEYSIRDIYVGYMITGMPYHTSVPVPDGMTYVGFRRTIETPPGGCRTEDTLNIAWFADNDGNPTIFREWDYRSPKAVIGFQLLRPGSGAIKTNFNWIASGFAPRSIPTDEDPYRQFAYPGEAPRVDVDKYYMMSHPEIDYDLMFTAVGHTGEGFMPPPDQVTAEYLAGGYPASFLFSFGPFNLEPGDSVPFTMAYIAGDDFHVNPWDYQNYFDPYRPETYYSKLDFSDLANNSKWARAIFDNPGVDTDGDGYRGEFCWKYIWRDTTEADPSDSFVVDSFRYFYTGDTIPDFRAMTPPPPPALRVYPDRGKVILRWNGQESENTPDYFSGQVDFEGYRVYYGQGNRLSDYVLLASYDIDDFIVYQFDTDNRFWKKISNSARHDSLKQIYGRDFDANDYDGQYNYFLDPYTGKIYYYMHQDWNQSDLSNPLGIHKIYPDASLYDSLDITVEGWRRYYEYEYVIDNLQPSVPYYFAVTAFDYGALQYDIGQLETSPQTNAIKEYPLPSSDTVEHRGLHVIVYPNPYRIDRGYARAGYENRDRTRAAAWSRRIHFANLPRICKIRIYTLAGDLVQELDHYYPEGGPASQHEEWNVISRNTQEVVTGIYIWSVRSEMGEQLGKLVIIK